MPGLYPDNPVVCDPEAGGCGTHFVLTPGHATDGLACPECGGKRLFMQQPSPTQSDGTLRDMVDSDTQKDEGGNPLGEGTIAGDDGFVPYNSGSGRGRDDGTYSRTAEFPAVRDEYSDIPDGMSAQQWRQQPQRDVACPLCGEPVGDQFSLHAQQFHPELWAGNRMAAVTERVMPRQLNMEPYMPWTHEASVHTAGPVALAPLAVEGEAAALPGEAAGAAAAGGAIADAAGAAGGGIADAASGAWNSAKGFLGGIFGGGASGVAKKIAPTLLKGALKAGEGALGIGQGGQGQQAGGMAPEPVTQAPNMMSYGSADIPWLLVAAFEDAQSVDSVDEQEDDPHKQDQKEFSDGDDSPSNHKNPNNEDSGADGEDGPRQDQPGFGLGENSPGLERLEMILPLLLHYFESPESGLQDPIIKALHETLEKESPGYLDQEDPEGPQMMEIVMQHHKSPRGVHAGVGPFPSGIPALPLPGNGMQAPGAGSCPQCHGTLNGDGSCPQCGYGGQKSAPDQTAVPGNEMPAPPQGGPSLPPMMANHVGPVTPEQIEAVAQLLISQGRGGEIEIMKQNPQLYAKELDEIQQNPQPAAPLVDPSQSQPPAPMEGAPGASPMPMPGGPGGGAPMQPMSRFAEHVAEVMAAYPPPPLGQPHQGGVGIPGAHVPLPCTHCHGQGCQACNFEGLQNVPPLTPQTIPGEGYQTPGRLGPADMTPMPQAIEQSGLLSPSAQGLHNDWRNSSTHVADANNKVPRCPKCGTATTTLMAGSDNDPGEPRGKCHNPGCGHMWKLKASSQRWAQLPNTTTLPAAGQHAPIDQAHTHDPSMQWVDNSGAELAAGQTYELYSPAFSVPDIIRILDVKPDAISVQLVGQYSNQDQDQEADFEIDRHEAQLEHYEFVPYQGDDQNMDDRNTEPPTGTPGLEQVPPSGPTTDEHQDSYPNTALSHVHDGTCMKCGSVDIYDEMSSPTTIMHQCFRCSHAWETTEEDEGRTAGVDLSWLREDSSPLDFTSERAMAMERASSGSRNIGDIAAKDARLQAIKSTLDSAPKFSDRMAGRQFTHGERRELIDETGHARNLGNLDLSNTHYDTRIDYTGKADGDNAPDEHLVFGL